MIGRTISHYTILEKLGEGGMGVVYKARDLTLNRIVALKFLPPHLTAGEEEGSRLLQEARAASILNHPGICTIHAIGEDEGSIFIDLEFVDGQTLGSLMRHGPLPVDTAIPYAIQICEAFHEAHANGIVHRDIKAENVMVTTRGRIKVMDFGLAKLKGSAKITRPLSTVGTLAYMAPEQIQGGEADARSDIFSFGVLLYEMLAGRLPFHGDHEAAIVYSVAHENPEPLSSVRPGIPAELERIVSRALEKDPAARYQSSAELIADLGLLERSFVRPGESRDAPRLAPPPTGTKPGKKHGMRSGTRWVLGGALAVILIASALVLYRSVPGAGGGKSGGRKMLVVLPFENLGAPDRDYFADGITEEITSKLSGLSGLGVIARTSAMQYRKTQKSVGQIGGELGVQYILQGTVRWEDAGGQSRVRVTPQLINVGDGTQMWSQPSEAVLSGVFTIQSEIASKVADALNVTLLQPERRLLESKLTDNPEAYDNYLRGMEYQHRSNNERDLLVAVEKFSRAVELDPNFAWAYAALSGVHSAVYWEYYDHTEDRLRKTKETAERALALDPDLPEAHAAMGFYYYHGLRDYESARREFDRGLAVEPRNEDLLIGRGSVARRIGMWDDALADIGKSVESDPRATVLLGEYAVTCARVRKYDEAEKYLDRALELAPLSGDAYFNKAEIALLRDGSAAKACGLFNEARSRKIDGSDSRYVYWSVMADECAGRFQDALDGLAAQQANVFPAQEQYIPRDLFQARLCGFLGRAKDARGHYDAARLILEKEAGKHPEDPRVHSSLGIVYAGLGRKEEAIREGKTATGLLPVSRDALIGPLFVRDLAEIYAMVGERRAAVEQLGYLLSIPSETSVPYCRIDPAWTPLHGDPEFRKLTAGQPTGTN